MRIALFCLLAALVFMYVPAMAAGDHVKLDNIGVTVSMEEEQTTISLFLDGPVEPEKVETDEGGILVFDLPDVELTAANEGVTSFMVFSPSVASIKLTQLETAPYLTRLEIYTNDERDYVIQTVGGGIDFIIFPLGGTPVLSEEPAPEEYEVPEEIIEEEAVEEEAVEEEAVEEEAVEEEAVEEEAVEEEAVEEEAVEEEAVEEEAVEEEAVEEPEEEIVEEPVEEEFVEEPPEGEDPLGYKPFPADAWTVTETEEEEPVEEEAEIIEEEPEVVEEEPEDTTPPPREEIEIIEEIVMPEPTEEEPEEEPVEEPPAEEEEEGEINLLEGINLLETTEEEAEPVEPVVEEPPVEEPEVVETEEAEEETITIETPTYVPTAGAVKLDNLNFQASDPETDLLVFAMIEDYPGEARTNFVHKKGFIVLSHCDVSDFVTPGEFKTVELSGKHLRYIVININDSGEAVFSLILTNPEAEYKMDVEINGALVMVHLKLAE